MAGHFRWEPDESKEFREQCQKERSNYSAARRSESSQDNYGEKKYRLRNPVSIRTDVGKVRRKKRASVARHCSRNRKNEYLVMRRRVSEHGDDVLILAYCMQQASERRARDKGGDAIRTKHRDDAEDKERTIVRQMKPEQLRSRYTRNAERTFRNSAPIQKNTPENNVESDRSQYVIHLFERKEYSADDKRARRCEQHREEPSEKKMEPETRDEYPCGVGPDPGKPRLCD